MATWSLSRFEATFPYRFFSVMYSRSRVVGEMKATRCMIITIICRQSAGNHVVIALPSSLIVGSQIPETSGGTTGASTKGEAEKN